MLFRLILASALLLPLATQAADITRQIPVDDKFAKGDVTFQGTNNGFDYRLTVINAKGNLEVCGAILYRRGSTGSTFRRFLKDSAFEVNGRKVVKDLSYWRVAKSSWSGAKANCTSLGIKSNAKIDKMNVAWSRRAYRN